MKHVEEFVSRIYTGEEGEKQSSIEVDAETVYVYVPYTLDPSGEEVDAAFYTCCSHGEYDWEIMPGHLAITFERDQLITTEEQKDAWKGIEQLTKLVRAKNRLIDLV